MLFLIKINKQKGQNMKLKYVKAGRQYEDRYELWVITRDYKNHNIEITENTSKSISDESWHYRMMAEDNSSCLLVGEIRGFTDWNNDRSWRAYIYDGMGDWEKYDHACYEELHKHYNSLSEEKELLEDAFMTNGVSYL